MSRKKSGHPDQLDLWHDRSSVPITPKPEPAPIPPVEHFKLMLKTNWKWASRGCVAIWDLQTQDEKQAGYSLQNNGKGFTAFDAPELSTIAQKIKANVRLSNYEVNLVHYRMPKYARQLRNLALKKWEDKNGKA